jgi:flagellar basal-body rod modification protein FlgD
MTSTAVAPTNAAAAAATTPTKGATNAATSGATGTSSTGASSISINGGLASLAGNFQSFLSLLTTQLQNQDPLNPTDTNQFTQQITQMTGVEQQLISNQLLQQLVSQQTGIGAAASLIGDTVTAPGAKSTDPAVSGTVTAVSESNGQTLLTVGGNQIPLSSITGVTGVSNPLSSLLGG